MKVRCWSYIFILVISSVLILFVSGLPVFRKPHRRGSRGSHASGVESSSSVLPPATKTRLHTMFRELEKEFEALYVENVQLREKIAILEKGRSK